MSKRETWHRHTLIMKVFARDLWKGCSSRERDQEEIFIVSNVATQFGHMALPVPILSVFEALETRIGRERLIWKKTERVS